VLARRRLTSLSGSPTTVLVSKRNFQPAAADDGADHNTLVTFAYPERLSRWQPLVKWLLAVPHYLVLLALGIAAMLVVVAGFFAVLVAGQYPRQPGTSWSVSTATDDPPTASGSRPPRCRGAERLRRHVRRTAAARCPRR
jgi:hypothetical protein